MDDMWYKKNLSFLIYFTNREEKEKGLKWIYKHILSCKNALKEDNNKKTWTILLILKVLRNF